MRDREEAIDWARRIAEEPEAVFVDTETTGLGADAEIVDIAIVRVDGLVLLDQLVCPVRSIPLEASRVHGITERMVHKAPMWRELWIRVAEIIYPGRVVVVFNAEYDFGIINQVTRAERLREFPAGWHCAMKRYGAFQGERSRRGVGYRWWKLGQACAAMGVSLDGAHRALADAEACRRLVLAMAADAKPAESGQLELFGTLAPIAGSGRDWTR